MSQKLEASFSTLVFSIGSAAAMHLGLAPNPANGKTEVDLNLARLNIDLLILLQEKTKNNLSNEEKTLVDAMVTDLQLRFVNAQKEKKE